MIQKIFSFIILLLLTFNLNAEDIYNKKLKFITPYDFIRWNVLDDFNFEKTNNWNLSENIRVEKEGSPRVAEIYLKKIIPGVTFKHVQSKRFLSPKYDKNPSCLGVKVYFPEFVRENVLLIPKVSYRLEGNCRKISFWLLGRGKNVDFELALRDYLGRLYYLPVTKLDFLGWKYFEVNIPVSIKQNYNLYPQQEIVEVAGFLVANYPTRYTDEIYGPIYIYIDQLEFYSDQFQNIYPGVEISDDW